MGVGLGSGGQLKPDAAGSSHMGHPGLPFSLDNILLPWG